MAELERGAGRVEGSRAGRPGPQALLVLLVCAAVYWPRLGADGFLSSEGHRVIPAWGMLDSGEFGVPRLFEQVYLRKPPGFYWAIAGSSAVFGRTEFAARAVSAGAMTAGALLSFWFARRWFGRVDPRAGVYAGLAHALSPWFWQIGRVAEIEALHQLAVQAAVFTLVDMTVWAPKGHPVPRVLWSGAGGLAIAAMGLVKGPAGAPCLGAALAAAWVASGSPRALVRPAVLAAFLVGAAVLAPVIEGVAAAAAGGRGVPVVQSLWEFLWPGSDLSGVAMVVPTALGSAVPLSLGLAFAWVKRDAYAAEARLARTLGWACVLAIGVYLSLGIENRRYTLPAFAFVAPLVGYAIGAVGRGWPTGAPRLLGRALSLERPWILATGLIVWAGVWFAIIEPRREARSGRAAGLRLATLVGSLSPMPSEIWADGLIEARPEVLAYAERALRRDGKQVHVRWVKGASLPRPGNLFVLRDDPGGSEAGLLARMGWEAEVALLATDSVHKFSYRVYRVVAAGGAAAR